MRAEFPSGHKLKAVLLTTAVAGGVLAVAGCRSTGPPRPSGRLPVVNAALKDDVPLYVDRAVDADARVVARCRACDAFWKATRGDWEYTWGVARFDVLAVERGSWPHPTLDFLCWDSWPTLESGMVVDKQVWPYREGVTLAFDLDTTQQPALVVGQVVRYDPLRESATQQAAP